MFNEIFNSISLDILPDNINRSKFTSIDLSKLSESEKLNDLFESLNDLLEQGEINIAKEYDKSFKTDDYENKIIYFTKSLMISIIPYHQKLFEKQFEIPSYMKFIRKRHVGYAYYSILNSLDENIQSNPFQVKDLYLGLAKFYKSYFGRFSDNEEAIELICKYYIFDDKFFTENETEIIINALYRHISNAGTPLYSGYAFKGISLIRKYIKNLPQYYIEQLLKEYGLFSIINNKVIRNQVFEIINTSSLNDEDKKMLKFFFLDSLIIANTSNSYIYIKYKNDTVNPLYNQYNIKLSIDKIGLMEFSTNQNLYAYWDNDISKTRNFYIDSNLLLALEINFKANRIYFIENKDTNFQNKMTIEFIYDDWMLEKYNSKEFETKIYNFISEKNSTNQLIYKEFTFSYRLLASAEVNVSL
ncbi:hypothetical protein [Lysinibacillus sp. NPDC096212]|uniref:hypothetical protein n=1 Tax=Lysinibacillus sp. NPDC096212 TaxID=3364135 RepID=UPI0038085405